MANQANAAALAQLQAIIAGLQKQSPSTQFMLGNVSYTTPTLVQALQSLADTIAAVVKAHHDVTEALTAWNAARVNGDPLITDVKRYLQTSYGSSANALAVFGLAPRKVPAPLTTEQRAARAAKAAATRKARGTTSKKQKLAVVGNVSGVTITPVTEPATAPTTPAASSSTQAPAPSPATGK